MADYTKYNCCGKKALPKNRLVFNVIKDYIDKYPKITFKELKNIFDKNKFSMSLEVVADEDDKKRFMSKTRKENPEAEFARRYFQQTLSCSDRDKIWITTEWGKDIEDKGRYFDAFLRFAKNDLGYEISENEQDNNAIDQKELKDRVDLIVRNIVLYGPPGTGKTVNYRRIIDSIESGQSIKNIFDLIKENSLLESEYSDYNKAEDEGRVRFVTFHQNFSYEDFIEGFRPNTSGGIKLEKGIFKEICEKAQESDQHHYLIIDEINRGNISKIFGELITLIEEDKRGKLTVTLPYSKEPFTVPENLYIIATMNSTDKSIALIDVALRRRFTFVKMMPNPELVENEEAKTMMVELNKFITEKLGEDFQIGHSYFMTDDLDFAIDYKIVPLLEEYFFADAEGLREAKRIVGREG